MGFILYCTVSLVRQTGCIIDRLWLSYSTVVLYIGIGDFGPKLSPQNQLDICFLALWEYWLGLAKPKSVFRSILDPSIK